MKINQIKLKNKLDKIGKKIKWLIKFKNKNKIMINKVDNQNMMIKNQISSQKLKRNKVQKENNQWNKNYFQNIKKEQALETTFNWNHLILIKKIKITKLNSLTIHKRLWLKIKNKGHKRLNNKKLKQNWNRKLILTWLKIKKNNKK